MLKLVSANSSVQYFDETPTLMRFQDEELDDNDSGDEDRIDSTDIRVNEGTIVPHQPNSPNFRQAEHNEVSFLEERNSEQNVCHWVTSAKTFLMKTLGSMLVPKSAS